MVGLCCRVNVRLCWKDGELISSWLWRSEAGKRGWKETEGESHVFHLLE